MLDTIGGIFVVAGAAFIALAGFGVLRLQDVIGRMHAATKASTLGIMLTALGAGLRLGDWSDLVKLMVAVMLVFITAPVAAHLVGRAAYHSDTYVHRTIDVDELASRPLPTEHADPPR